MQDVKEKTCPYFVNIWIQMKNHFAFLYSHAMKQLCSELMEITFWWMYIISLFIAG